jgi:hypothetical protein
MMSSTGNIPWKRVLAEFFAIAAAVYLGLLADNYREFRAGKATESEYLTLLAQDLDSDLSTLLYTRQGIEKQARAAELIHGATAGKPVMVPDLERAFSQLFITWTYEQQRPTYLALRSGLGLHVLSDFELRSALVSYYEIDQMRLQQDYITNYDRVQQRLRTRLDKHVRFLPPDEFDSLMAIPADFHVARLNAPVATIGEDIELMNNLAELGGRGFELVKEIDRLRETNRELQARLVATIRR